MYPSGRRNAGASEEHTEAVATENGSGFEETPTSATITGGRTYGSLALKDDMGAVEARFRCPIRFQGQWEDEETGLYYNRFRYYDPLAAQYVSTDPIRLDGGLRPHAYVGKPTT